MRNLVMGQRIGVRNSTGADDLTVTGFAVTPSSPTIILLAQLQLSAVQTLSDGSTRNVSAQATWSSSNPLIATVLLGLASALAVGDATVTATFAGRTAQASVHVSLT